MKKGILFFIQLIISIGISYANKHKDVLLYIHKIEVFQCLNATIKFFKDDNHTKILSSNEVLGGETYELIWDGQIGICRLKKIDWKG